MLALKGQTMQGRNAAQFSFQLPDALREHNEVEVSIDKIYGTPDNSNFDVELTFSNEEFATQHKLNADWTGVGGKQLKERLSVFSYGKEKQKPLQPLMTLNKMCSIEWRPEDAGNPNVGRFCIFLPRDAIFYCKSLDLIRALGFVRLINRSTMRFSVDRFTLANNQNQVQQHFGSIINLNDPVRTLIRNGEEYQRQNPFPPPPPPPAAQPPPPQPPANNAQIIRDMQQHLKDQQERMEREAAEKKRQEAAQQEQDEREKRLLKRRQEAEEKERLRIQAEREGKPGAKPTDFVPGADAESMDTGESVHRTGVKHLREQDETFADGGTTAKVQVVDIADQVETERINTIQDLHDLLPGYDADDVRVKRQERFYGQTLVDPVLGFALPARVRTTVGQVALNDGEGIDEFVPRFNAMMESAIEALDCKYYPRFVIQENRLVLITQTNYLQVYPAIKWEIKIPETLEEITKLPSSRLVVDYKTGVEHAKGAVWNEKRSKTDNFLDRYQSFFVAAPLLSLTCGHRESYIESLGFQNVLFVTGLGNKRKKTTSIPFLLDSRHHKFEILFFDDRHKEIVFNEDLRLYCTLFIHH